MALYTHMYVVRDRHPISNPSIVPPTKHTTFMRQAQPVTVNYHIPIGLA